MEEKTKIKERTKMKNKKERKISIYFLDRLNNES